MKTFSGQPRFCVNAPAAARHAASTSGCSSRSTLIATKRAFRSAASAGSLKLSLAMTWHQWQVAYPIETSTGTSRSRAAANAASPHGYQSTGLLACDRR